MNTDIDHLHGVIEGRITGRQCGKTFSSIHQIAGFVDINHPNIIVVIKHLNELHYLYTMFENILNQHQLEPIKFNYNAKEIVVKYSKIIFVTKNSKEQRCRGLEYILYYL